MTLAVAPAVVGVEAPTTVTPSAARRSTVSTGPHGPFDSVAVSAPWRDAVTLKKSTSLRGHSARLGRFTVSFSTVACAALLLGSSAASGHTPVQIDASTTARS